MNRSLKFFSDFFIFHFLCIVSSLIWRYYPHFTLYFALQSLEILFMYN